MKNRSIYKIIIVLVASVFLLNACDVSDVNKLLGMDVPESSNETKNTETKDNDEAITITINETPVITIVNDEDGVITNEDIQDVSNENNPDTEMIPEYEEIYDPVNKIYSIETSSPDEVTLSFVGDVGFAQGYATINICRQQPNGIYDCILPEVMEIMQGTDIMMANNEFPYSYRGTPTPDKTYTFRADPEDVSLMTSMGVDIVSLANNHAYDYGPDALIDTVDTLNEARLPFVGAGKNIEEAMKPAYFHVNGKVVSYVSATQIERYGNPDTKEATADSPGVLRTLEPSKAVAVIKEAEANSDFVVMYVHWGSESTDLVEQSQRDLARAYVDAGADLIIGDHSHCLQGIDYIDDVPVFYSLGNFWFNSKTLDTCIVKATLDNDCKISKLEFIPCIQSGCKVKIGDGDNYDRILEYMRGISDYAEIDSYGCVTKSDVNHNRQNGQNTSPAKRVATPVPEASPEVITAVDDSTVVQ